MENCSTFDTSFLIVWYKNLYHKLITINLKKSKIKKKNRKQKAELLGCSIPNTDTNWDHIPLVFHCSERMADRRLPLLKIKKKRNIWNDFVFSFCSGYMWFLWMWMCVCENRGNQSIFRENLLVYYIANGVAVD